MALQLLFPKFVVVKNAYLVALYHTLLAVLFVMLVMRFWKASQFAQFVQISQYVHPVLSASGNVEDIRAQAHARIGGPGCAPGATDFWWDPEGEFRWTNFTCVDLCPEAPVDPMCIPPDWLSMQENGYTVFFPTSVESADPNTSMPLKHFILGTEALSISLEYSMQIPTFTWLAQEFLLDGDSKYYFTGASTRNILTVVMDTNKKTVDYYHYPQQGRHISLSVPKLMQLSGAIETLDDFLPEMGSNFLLGAMHPEGPNVRVSGLELVIEINCHQSPTPNTEPPDWSTHTCYVTVEPVWSWSRIERLGPPGLSKHIFHGVRVKAKTSGVFGFWSFEKCFYNFVSALVLMKLPRTFVRLFAVYCLGGLSRIYKKVVYETFSLSDQIAGTLTRLMVSSLSFRKLRDSEGGISKDQYALACIAALKRGNLISDPEAIREIVKITFGAISRQLIRRRRQRSWFETVCSIWRQLKRFFMEPPDESVVKTAVMDVDGFVDVCGNLDHVHFDDVVNLFDRNRKVGYLEWIFTPKVLRHHEEQARSKDASDSMLDQEMHRILSSEVTGSQTAWCRLHENSAVYHISSKSETTGEEDSKLMRQVAAKVWEAPSVEPSLRIVESELYEAEAPGKKAQDVDALTPPPMSTPRSPPTRQMTSGNVSNAVMALSTSKAALVMDHQKLEQPKQRDDTMRSSTGSSNRRRRGTKVWVRRALQALRKVRKDRAKERKRWEDLKRTTCQMASKYDAALSVLRAEIDHLSLNMDRAGPLQATATSERAVSNNVSSIELEKRIRKVMTMVSEANMEAMAQTMDVENAMDRRMAALEAHLGRIA